jgi:hypothetical protein
LLHSAGCGGGALGVLLKTSENLEKFRKFEGREIAKDIQTHVSGKKSAEKRAARPSIHPTADGDPSRCDDGSSWSNDGSSGNRACGNAARPIDTGSTDDGVGFHSA